MPENLRFPDIYQVRRTRPVISFEVFPPKTDAALANLLHVLPELAALRPDFMTVTYGAMGTTQTRTLELSLQIKDRFRVPTACHLTCVGATRRELESTLDEIRAKGIRNVVALRGDPPQGQAEFVPPEDGFAHANELVAYIRQCERERNQEPFGIAVAGYPEKHIEAPDTVTDLANLKRKVMAGADVVITQLFFDNALYFDFVLRARAIGITQPIVPGLMPILSVKQLLRITSMCGASIPDHMRPLLEAAGDDPQRAEDVGVRQCVAQARGLLERGVPGIHFYVLNRSGPMRRIVQQLQLI